MTHYRTANDAQRDDPELIAAITKELQELTGILKGIQTKLFAAQDYIREGMELEELDLGIVPSPLRQTYMYVSEATKTLNYMINGNPGEIYIETTAAYMSSQAAEELKEKHRGG